MIVGVYRLQDTIHEVGSGVGIGEPDLHRVYLTLLVLHLLNQVWPNGELLVGEGNDPIAVEASLKAEERGAIGYRRVAA